MLNAVYLPAFRSARDARPVAPSQAPALLLACLAALPTACAETHASEGDALAALLAAADAPSPAAALGEGEGDLCVEQEPAAAVCAPSEAPAAAVDGGAPTGCPEGMASVGRFCIDRYEAHLVARGPDGELRVHPHSRRPERGVVYEARSAPGVFPQAYVSRIESSAACANAGKRLCSRKEWQRACRGARGLTYPYAERRQANRCNSDKPHLLTLRFGPDPMRWRYEHFNDPALSQEPGFLARSGEHAECVGDAGVYDLVGNLHEWVSDTVDTALMTRIWAEDASRSFQPWRIGNGVFMGGFFSTREEHGRGCSFTTVAHEPRYHDYSTGFRCCADPESS
jgi:sulfatase modifying factor 1